MEFSYTFPLFNFTLFSTYPVLHILTHLLRSRNLENKLFCWWRVKEPLALVMKVCWTWMIGLRTWRSRKWALQTPWNENAMNYNYFLYWKLYLWYFFMNEFIHLFHLPKNSQHLVILVYILKIFLLALL